MPAVEADIHGIERHPVAKTQPSTLQSERPCSPTGDPTEDGHSIPNNNPFPDQPPPSVSPNEQGTTAVALQSSVKQSSPTLKDSVGRLDEDATVVDKTIDTNDTTSVPDSV